MAELHVRVSAADTLDFPELDAEDTSRLIEAIHESDL